jgi:broad specificity phosphatase PhoE
VKIPSGEKMAKFSSRVKNEFNRIVKEAGDRHDTVAVVSHVGPMRVFLNDLAGIKRKDFWSLEIEPGAIFIIGYSRRSKPKAHKL